jgi:cell division protein FtsL
MDTMVSILTILLIISFSVIYLMNIRIKQLERQFNDLRSRVTVTDEELTRLAKDIEEFKKIKI